MRTRLALALILCIAVPPMAWTATPDSSPSAGASSLASPAAAACALVRNSANAEKTLSGDWSAGLDGQPHHPASEHAVFLPERTTDPSHLDLDNPPVAPRPPPFS
jgi:hypothetical protein